MGLTQKAATSIFLRNTPAKTPLNPLYQGLSEEVRKPVIPPTSQNACAFERISDFRLIVL